MKVYKLNVNTEDFCEFYFPVESDREEFEALSDELYFRPDSLSKNWGEFVILKEEIRHDPDIFLLLDEFPVFSDTAKYKLMDAGVEMSCFPLISDEQTYYIFSPKIPQKSPLDSEKTEFKKMPLTGTSLGIEHYSFIAEELDNLWLFRLMETPFDIYITDRFCDFWASNELSGLELLSEDLVWTNEV